MDSLGSGVKLIKFDINGLVALDKPIGIMSHPNVKSIEKNSLINAAYDQKLKKYLLKNDLDFFLLNRLDSPTSGLLIGCFDHELAKAVIASFATNKVKKKYMALAKFTPCQKHGHWKDFLKKTLINNKLRLEKIIGEKCLTDYKILEIINFKDITLALLELKPITGKTHQLRAQCAIHNLPIAGDKIYGDFKLIKLLINSNQQRMFLHSEELELSYKLQNKEYKFFANSGCEFKNMKIIKLILLH
jgi:23S rRNA-/tRNA-specific pseudouridylate synthase